VRCGIDVERIVNEPTAASMAYGLDDDLIRQFWFTTSVGEL
jgi:Hsp70 protein.